MKILFWVGYQKTEWDGNTTSGIAGSELAVLKIAERLVNFGWDIVVSGVVKDSGKINGVVYCGIEHIHKRHFDTFDVIVGTNYLHMPLEFEGYIKAKKVFWAHNTDGHPYWRGDVMSTDTIDDIMNPSTGLIDTVVTLTWWHSTIWEQNYGWKKTNQCRIANGIDVKTFVGHPPKKINSFIWSSAIDRGLVELLENWHKIKGALSDATLNVYWPSYSNEYEEMKWIKEHQLKFENMDVTFHGPVDQITLHRAMLESDMWCYLTDYYETYCITALEMQYAKVLPIATRVAALVETVHSGIILDNDETKWDKLVETLKQMSPSLKEFAKNKGYQWAKKQTWDERAYLWKDLIDGLTNDKKEFKKIDAA
tara:strand:+ start:680 stop:1777 length:1098 start_codon:yes stop_codon:yes gene_type:complete